MRDYIAEQSIGEIIRNTFEVYFSNFLPIFLIYFVPVFPFKIMLLYGELTDKIALSITGNIINGFIVFFSISAITIAVSDICVGNKPSFFRAYRAIFDKKLVGSIILAGLLQMVIIVIGLLLLIIPGLLFVGWFMLTQSIVILERKSAVQALKHSKELSKGLYLRNIGALILLGVIMFGFGAVIGGVSGMVIAMSGGPSWLLRPVVSVVEILSPPAGEILVVL